MLKYKSILLNKKRLKNAFEIASNIKTRNTKYKNKNMMKLKICWIRISFVFQQIDLLPLKSAFDYKKHKNLLKNS